MNIGTMDMGSGAVSNRELIDELVAEAIYQDIEAKPWEQKYPAEFTHRAGRHRHTESLLRRAAAALEQLDEILLALVSIGITGITLPPRRINDTE
jgi:uncharacterized lipoprotein YddW (UPF0748 family)